MPSLLDKLRKITQYLITVRKKESRTVSLKLVEPPDKDFWDTISAYVSALNFVSDYAWNDQLTNPLTLQSYLYGDVRTKYKLKSQMSVNVFRQVSAAYRTAKKNGYRWEEPIKFSKNSILLNYPRDFGINGDIASIGVLKGRKKVRFVCGQHQKDYLDNGWEIHSATMIKRQGNYYLNISVSKEFEVSKIDDRVTIVGVDLGINNMAVASTTEGSIRRFKGGEIKNKKRQFEHTRSSLQAKGTRSAKRVLRNISGRERRFMADVNHQVSKDLVAWASTFEKPVIALEDLRGIRKRVGTRKNKKSNKGSRRSVNKWSYFQLRTFIEYKANQLGIPVVYVEPAYTSQTCPRCGHVSDENRDGQRFTCVACKYNNNADIVGSFNIRTKATVSRYIFETAGSPSMTPEVSPDDAEALSSELMPKADTIPQL